MKRSAGNKTILIKRFGLFVSAIKPMPLRHYINMASSKEKREIYRLERNARKASMQNNWADAINYTQQAISKYQNNIPIDMRLSLSKMYQKADDLLAAEQTIVDGITSLPAHKNGDVPSFVTQKDLESWLALTNERAEISALKRLGNIDQYKSSIGAYNAKRISRKRSAHLKIVVFCAISGGYDSIKLPETLDPRLDYVLFTDTVVDSVGIYNIQPLPYIDSDKTRSARYVKTNPHHLFPDYDVAVWVDANILITEDIYPLINGVLRSGKSFGAFRHPVRKSVFEEIDACLVAKKDDHDAILEQKEKYIRENFDCDDLIESNFLVYDLRDKKLGSFLNDWWNQLDKYSRRDQLSINYCLVKNNINWHSFTKRPNTVRNHLAFALTRHGSSGGTFSRLIRSLDPVRVDPFEIKPYEKVKKRRIGNQQKRTVDIVLCVHNAIEDVKKCLASIVVTLNQTTHRVIIVDDGSGQPTASYLKNFQEKNFSWVTLLRNRKAEGYTKAANRGLRYSTAEFVVLLNSDTIVTTNWIEKMVDVSFSNAGVGIVGPISSAASHQSIPDHRNSKEQTVINKLPFGLSPEAMNIFCEKNASAQIIPRVPLVHGFCFGIRREVIDKIGYFDEDNFPRGYGEENDYCFRAADAGFGLAIAAHTYIFHAKSKSYIDEERIKLMQAGAAAFRKKYGQRRISRAIATVEGNPVLDKLRHKAKIFYEEISKTVP